MSPLHAPAAPRRSPFVRLLAVATLAGAASVCLAQSGFPPGRWSCDLNGRDIDIRIAGDEATVRVAGAEARVLKRREIRSGGYYTDGSAALRHRGGEPAQANEPQWIQNGEVSALRRCLPDAR
jgi:hypothetical protein